MIVEPDVAEDNRVRRMLQEQVKNARKNDFLVAITLFSVTSVYIDVWHVSIGLDRRAVVLRVPWRPEWGHPWI